MTLIEWLSISGIIVALVTLLVMNSNREEEIRKLERKLKKRIERSNNSAFVKKSATVCVETPFGEYSDHEYYTTDEVLKIILDYLDVDFVKEETDCLTKPAHLKKKKKKRSTA